jgi:hypothetical protein
MPGILVCVSILVAMFEGAATAGWTPARRIPTLLAVEGLSCRESER